METFSALLAICAGNSPVPGEFPTQRPVTRSFDVYFDLRPNKWLSKQSWGWWFETLSCSLWRHRNEGATAILYTRITNKAKKTHEESEDRLTSVKTRTGNPNASGVFSSGCKITLPVCYILRFLLVRNARRKSFKNLNKSGITCYAVLINNSRMVW